MWKLQRLLSNVYRKLRYMIHWKQRLQNRGNIRHMKLENPKRLFTAKSRNINLTPVARAQHWNAHIARRMNFQTALKFKRYRKGGSSLDDEIIETHHEFISSCPSHENDNFLCFLFMIGINNYFSKVHFNEEKKVQNVKVKGLWKF